MNKADTIAALSTPSAESAVALIRLSGPECLKTASTCFGRDSQKSAPRTAHFAKYKSISGEVLDEVVFTCFVGPASYTGEDMLEISCHGSPFIIQNILEDLFARGCRAAQPGEFTRRAFLNDKMDLSQAEAVSLVIGARSRRAATAAQRQLSGELGKKINSFCDRLVDIAALLEAYIDFPEDDLPPEDSARVLKNIEDLRASFAKLADTSKYSSLVHGGINVAIVGEPNAGKSSLLNCLLGSRRAIVSDVAGTTRDFIAERLIIGDHAVNIVDTAGLHEAQNAIESMGIEMALEQIEKADICLITLDAPKDAPALPAALSEKFNGRNAVVVLNKCDIAISESAREFLPDCARVEISCLNETGIGELKNALINLIETHHISAGADDILVGARHAQSLEKAEACLRTAAEKIKHHTPAELVSSDLREAMEAVGEIVGKIDSEAVLDKIFSGFCIGK